MPTYAYACTACEHRFEIVQSFVDDSLTECPECTGRLRKLFNAVGVVFKGSGFYRTDSRNEDRKGSGSSRYSSSGSANRSASSTAGGSSSGSSSTPSDSSKAGATKTAPKSDSSPTSSKTVSTSQGSAA